nr:cell wall hydrolase [uncultured Schaedlerella sp.]
MKAKAIVNLGLVIGLAALSAAAYGSTIYMVPDRTMMGHGLKHRLLIETEESENTGIFTKIPLVVCPNEKAYTFCQSGDTYLLAKIAMAEAEGEDTEGKALVMRVVLNRVKEDGFPDTVKDVIYQSRQFSPVTNGRFDRVEPDDDCWKALCMIEQDDWDESKGATYFESKSESNWHKKNLDFLFQYGSHYFYMDKEEKHE